MTAWARRVAVGAGAAAIAVLAWPAVDPSSTDSLPVSNYPMFARPRPSVNRFPVVVLHDADHGERRLDPREISGTDQPMQAAMTVSQAVREGTAAELCAEIAAALAEPGTIEVVTATYDAIAWFDGDERPIEREVHAACEAGAAP
ncbi:MAG TPA: hypothetical protein VNQ73_21340 [Ilumatobacter sp.]|nr:hypothetical protein [Ilumatobacter sp.]